jgi:hypothetical protein
VPRPFGYLPVVVVSGLAVVPIGPHAALLIGTVGIDILAGFLVAYVFDALQFFGMQLPHKTMFWILTGTPYYPVQIGLGLLLGWSIGRRVQHRTMLWVWILPSIYLMYALIAIPALVPWLIPPEYQAGVGESRL